jgi:type IV secretory pathway VirB10-like protein
MNTIWLKIAGVFLVVVIALVVLGRWGGNKSAPAPEQTQAKSEQAQKPKTFYDMADRDKQFNEPPKPVEPPAPQSAPQPEPQPPQPPAQPPGRPSGVVYPSDLKGPTTLYFKRMSEEDDIQAQQLLPYATAGRSIGRLPVMQYGLMMKACEQIEQRWPDSWYAFRAKQMEEEITQYQDRYAMMYKITPQRLDISRFMKPRQGTEPRVVEPTRR